MTTTVANAFDWSYQRHQRQGANLFSTEVSHPSSLRSVPLFLSPQNLVHPNEPPISDLLYAGFLEHLGRCIYGGIVDDYRAPSPAELLVTQDDGQALTKGRLGWRKDVKELLAKDGDLEIPMMRWPGGNFVSNYHWQDGIGPVEKRPKRIELAWLSDDPNMFGTDEFIDYCRATKIEPFICLNRTLEEALAWVEYCNGKGDSYWANLRRKNSGRDEPHNVKYWGLGNEMWGPWQVGNLTASDYTRQAKSWAHALKLVDPSIKLISCGHTGANEWDREVLATMVGYADLHSIHYYSMVNHDKLSPPGYLYEKNVFGPAAAERYIEVCQSLIDLANIERSNIELRPRNLKICFDEWNVWDKLKGNAKNGLEQWYDYTDMLGFVAWLNILVRKHKEVAIACLAQSVNVIAPLMTKPDGICKQTTYYPLRLFSRFMKGGSLLATPHQPDVYTGPTWPSHIQMCEMQPAYIDTVAIIVKSPNGSSIRLSVLNRHPEADWDARCMFDGFSVNSLEVHEMYSDDLDAVNTFEKPDTVVPAVTKLSGEEWAKKKSWTVRKHSWAFIIFDGTTSN